MESLTRFYLNCGIIGKIQNIIDNVFDTDNDDSDLLFLYKLDPKISNFLSESLTDDPEKEMKRILFILLHDESNIASNFINNINCFNKKWHFAFIIEEHPLIWEEILSFFSSDSRIPFTQEKAKNIKIFLRNLSVLEEYSQPFNNLVITMRRNKAEMKISSQYIQQLFTPTLFNSINKKNRKAYFQQVMNFFIQYCNLTFTESSNNTKEDNDNVNCISNTLYDFLITLNQQNQIELKEFFPQQKLKTINILLSQLWKYEEAGYSMIYLLDQLSIISKSFYNQLNSELKQTK